MKKHALLGIISSFYLVISCHSVSAEEYLLTKDVYIAQAEVPTSVDEDKEYYLTEEDYNAQKEVTVSADEDEDEDDIDQTGTTFARLGAGITTFNVFTGLYFVFDYFLNRDIKSAIRTQLAVDYTSVDSEGTKLNISRQCLTVSYNRLLPVLSDIYGGLGLGFGQSNMTYHNTNNDNKYDADGGGLFLMGEIGWKKVWKYHEHREFGLNVGLQSGVYIGYSDNYDETKVSNQTNHRDIVNTGWQASQQLSRFVVGFDVFF